MKDKEVLIETTKTFANNQKVFVKIREAEESNKFEQMDRGKKTNINCIAENNKKNGSC